MPMCLFVLLVWFCLSMVVLSHSHFQDKMNYNSGSFDFTLKYVTEISNLLPYINTLAPNSRTFFCHF